MNQLMRVLSASYLPPTHGEGVDIVQTKLTQLSAIVQSIAQEVFHHTHYNTNFTIVATSRELSLKEGDQVIDSFTFNESGATRTKGNTSSPVEAEEASTISTKSEEFRALVKELANLRSSPSPVPSRLSSSPRQEDTLHRPTPRRTDFPRREERSNSSLAGEITGRLQELKTLRGSYDESQKQLTALTATLQEMAVQHREEKQLLEERATSVAAELETLQAALSTITQEKASLATQLQTSEEQLAEVRSTLETLQASSSEEQATLEKQEQALTAQLETLQHTLSKTTAENSRFSSELAEKSAQLEQTRLQLQGLQTATQAEKLSLDKRAGALDTEVKTLTAQIQRITDENNSLKAQQEKSREDLKRAIKEGNEILTAMQQLKGNVESEKQELAIRIKRNLEPQIQQAQAEAQTLRERVSQLELQLTAPQSTLPSMEMPQESENERIAELEQQLRDAEKEAQEKREEAAALEEQLVQSNNTLREKEAALDRRNGVDEENQLLRVNLQKLAQKIDSLEQENRHLRMSSADSSKDVDIEVKPSIDERSTTAIIRELHQSNDSLKNQIRTEQEENDRLREQVRTLARNASSSSNSSGVASEESDEETVQAELNTIAQLKRELQAKDVELTNKDRLLQQIQENTQTIVDTMKQVNSTDTPSKALSFDAALDLMQKDFSRLYSALQQIQTIKPEN